MPGQAYLMYPAWFIPIHVASFLVDQCDSVACEREARAGEVQNCKRKRPAGLGLCAGIAKFNVPTSTCTKQIICDRGHAHIGATLFITTRPFVPSVVAGWVACKRSGRRT